MAGSVSPVFLSDSPTPEDEAASHSPITLQYMPQQSDIRCPDDDWTGVSDPVARRKAQNRLHQRAWRKRKAAQRSQYRQVQATTPSSSTLTTWTPRSATESVSPRSSSAGSPLYHPETTAIAQHNLALWNLFNSVTGNKKISTSYLSNAATVCHLTNTEITNLLSQFQKWASSSIVHGLPTADMLLTLVKINVFRAMISNAVTLGFAPDEGRDDDAISRFCKLPAPPTSLVLALPPALRPTDMQCRVPHHPWIDMLPFPAMRQNLIRAGDTYDDWELCGDLVGLFSSGTGRTGMIVWGEPWDVGGWEVTEQFVKHWGWTIRGCREIFESTNRWRAQRGERPLHFDGL